MKPKIISVFDKTQIQTGAHKRHIGLLRELGERDFEIYFFSPVNFLNLSKAYFFKISEHKEGKFPKSFQSLISVHRKFSKEQAKLPSKGVLLVFGFNHIYASLYLKWKLDLPLIFVLRSNPYEYRAIGFSNANDRIVFNLLKSLKKQCYLSAFKFIEHIVYRKAEKIIVQNGEDKEQLVNKYGQAPEKIKVIPNNINFFESTSIDYLNQSQHLKKIIFVGSLTNRKGIRSLLEAFKELIKEGVDLELSIIGNGKLESDIKRFIISNNISEVTKMHGFVEDPLEYIANADLLILPSISDSFPNTILEALFVGTPAIGSKVGGIAEILKDDFLLFEPDSVIAIKKAIKKMLTPENYKVCKIKCENRKEEFTFDWEKKFEEVIYEVYENKYLAVSN